MNFTYFLIILVKLLELKNIKRREFLSNVCPTVAFAIAGISIIEACSKDENVDVSEQIQGGFTVEGNIVRIDLEDSSFSLLSSQGWMNFTSQQILLLKLGPNSYRAFTNECPHRGNRNS